MRKTILATAILLVGSVGSLALAQQPSPSPSQSPSSGHSMPPSDYPQSTSPQSSADQGTSGATDKKTLLKQCESQQQERASSTGMSKKDIKEYCKKQVSQSSEQAPH